MRESALFCIVSTSFVTFKLDHVIWPSYRYGWPGYLVTVKLEMKISTLCDNYRPLKTLFSVNEAFKNTEGNIGQKFVFVLGNLANVGLAM